MVWGKDETDWWYDGKNEGKMFDYGLEQWCNMEGRYVTFEADMSSFGTSWDVSVCNIGIFGTVYERSTPV